MGRFEWLEFGNSTVSSMASAGEGAPVPSALSLEQEADADYMQGRFEQALRTYGRAAAEDPQRLESLLGQIYCQLALGEMKTALNWAVNCLRRFPGLPRAKSIYAYCLSHNLKLDEALKLFQELVSSAESQVPSEVLIQRLHCLWLCRMLWGTPLAPACFREQTADSAGDSSALDAGEEGAARLEEEIKELILQIQESLNRDPGPQYCWLALFAEVLTGAAQYQMACQCWERLCELCPSGWNMVRCGRCALNLGDSARAQELLSRALALDPDCKAAHELQVELKNSAPVSVWRRLKSAASGIWAGNLTR